MNIQEIIINFLTSSSIVGIATYLIHKRIDTRFKKLEEFQRTLVTIRKERYDSLLKTLQEIWEKLVETEYYIRWDLEKQLKESIQKKQSHLEFDSTPLKNALIFIEKRNILLDKTLSEKTREFFTQHLQNTYNGYIDMVRQAIAQKRTMEEVNNFIPNSLGVKFKEDSIALRNEFEKQAREILYDEK